MLLCGKLKHRPYLIYPSLRGAQSNTFSPRKYLLFLWGIIIINTKAQRTFVALTQDFFTVGYVIELLWYDGMINLLPSAAVAY
jgi:hypothetical protein